jgi:VanZ family protein
VSPPKPARQRVSAPIVVDVAETRPIPGPSRHWWMVAIWLAVLALMSTQIFTFTRTWVYVGDAIHLAFRAGVSDTTQTIIHLIIRKLAHFGAYTVFFLVLIMGPLRGRPYWALLICLMLATADETHQLFVPGRTGSPYDVAIDFTGAMFGRFLHYGIESGSIQTSSSEAEMRSMRP